jgi:radical SAM superfamily enzyme YgiQ (UPF0313 family)
MKNISKAGLSRIHVGLESGDDIVLKRVKKGSSSNIHIEAGKIVKNADIELTEYVILGLGGKDRTKEHIKNTINVLNKIEPDFIRIRTFLPKVNTPILEDINNYRFQILSPHEILRETYDLISGLDVNSRVFSDHYTNYIRIDGKLPEDKDYMLKQVTKALQRKEDSYRKVYLGRE